MQNFNENSYENIDYLVRTVYTIFKESDCMNTDLLEFTERLVPISDFSQGKAGKVFNDVAKNDRDYIVLKNNQPIAVLVSVNEYRNMQERIARLEKLVKETEETTKNLL